MTTALPQMATLSELIAATVRAASARVTEGSRRNARQALDTRADADRHGAGVLAALPAPPVG